MIEIGKLAEEGHLKPVIDTVYPFEHFQKGFYHIQTGRARGKVVFSITNH
jgi:NADPH:quinone reductase-like Zn-dependent oxidoreductase